ERIVIARPGRRFGTLDPSNHSLRRAERAHQIIVGLGAARSSFSDQPHLFDQLIDLVIAIESDLAPRLRMVTPLDQFPSRKLQLIDGRAAIERITPREADQSAAQRGSSVGELLLNPGAKGTFVDAGGLLFGKLFESG